MLKTEDVSNMIRTYSGIPIRPENKGITSFTRDEQLVMLAHLVKMDSIVKSKELSDEFITQLAERIKSEINSAAA